jgi:hypothetical protein
MIRVLRAQLKSKLFQQRQWLHSQRKLLSQLKKEQLKSNQLHNIFFIFFLKEAFRKEGLFFCFYF